MEIFDSHTHINASVFQDDLPDVIQRAKALDVTQMLVIGYDAPSRQRLQALIEQYPNLYGAVGCHPEDALNYSSELEQELRQILQQKQYVAVGEIGLDYYYDVDHQVQHAVFERQIALAQELKMPISVHNRDAFADTYAILKNMKIGQYGGIMHSFNGDAAWAEKFLDLGMELSYSGVVTFHNAQDVQAAALATPLEHLLVETDAPYLAPMPFRGEKNEPGLTRYTLEYLAELKGVSAEELAAITKRNTERVLQIDGK
ncbi:TatD family hydrolase [Ligilactobacillus ceti]|uniref:Hydrolase, TatD family n=1 Tax=Ligilactobacillus ceti DSM 22408 TaxID=1122146 RepID=A0A0R2KNW1_9LACO|nr:TatD family hydrolase [Ligilactobacillus ceti]KRN89398.1 hydrolase, TatD family [Ligilactobacillus ceti DSM 22408]